MNKPIVAVVLPCYNEQEALPVTIPKLLGLLDNMVSGELISPQSYLLCSDDGSTDQTWRTITTLHEADPRVRGIQLAHNRGHQYALLAGLMSVKDHCDCAISIDADLQDDPEVIRQMVEKFVNNGDEIVYGVRSSRQTDTWFKRTTAHAFYKLQRSMGLETIFDHADYRLMSNRALQMLSQYGESNLFLRGIVPNIGLKHSVVTYARANRVAGESKYPLKKMLSLSVDGITSFSAKPIRIIFTVGMLLLVADLLVGLWVLIAFLHHSAISGWASVLLSVWFLGSLMLISIGIVGEYIGKIFNEVKHRPRYAITRRLWNDAEDNDVLINDVNKGALPLE